jgi:hypothetical protein
MTDTNTTTDNMEAASVGELCTMLNLSKRRFYELQQRGVFPQASAYSVKSRRPIFFSDAIRTCLDVRRRHVGLNGEIVHFNARPIQPLARARAATAGASSEAVGARAARASRRSTPQPPSQHVGIIDALAALGVETTAARITEVVREAFPSGTRGVDEGEIIRRVYQQIRARNCGGNVQR